MPDTESGSSSSDRPRSVHFRVFISYSSNDVEFVDELATNLSNSNIDAWHSAAKVLAGDDLHRAIEEAIRSSKFMIVVMSEQSLMSEWVRAEISVGLTLEKEYGRVFVLPLFLSGIQNNIPAFLIAKKYVDFRFNKNTGFVDLLNAMQVKHDGSTTFIRKRPSIDWESALGEIPRKVLNQLDCFVCSGLDERGCGFTLHEIHAHGYDFERTWDDFLWAGVPTLDLSTYGLVTNALSMERSIAEGTQVLFAAQLTKLGYRIAHVNDTNHRNLHFIVEERLPDRRGS